MNSFHINKDTVLNGWGVLRCLVVGLLVRHKDGSVCTVEGFDITKGHQQMPVKFRRLCNGDEFAGILPDIIGVLIPAHVEVG